MKHLTILEELLMAFPQLEYYQGSLYQEDVMIEQNGNAIIANFYEDFDDMNPIGKDYIALKFNNDYAEAFNCVMSYSNIDKL